MCQAVVNEDPNTKMIRELREEIERLRLQMASGAATSGTGSTSSGTTPGGTDTPREEAVADAAAQLAASEKIMAELSATWEEKMSKTRALQAEREEALREMGIALTAAGGAAGVMNPSKCPHLRNLNEDPFMSELLLYFLNPGTSR